MYRKPSRVYAEKTVKSLDSLGEYLRKVNYYRRKTITISRKGLYLPDYKSMEIRQHCMYFYIFLKKFNDFFKK